LTNSKIFFRSRTANIPSEFILQAQSMPYLAVGIVSGGGKNGLEKERFNYYIHGHFNKKTEREPIAPAPRLSKNSF